MIKWTDEKVTKLARKYRYQRDFRENQYSAFHYAYRNGLLDSFTWLKLKRPKVQSEEECRRLASQCSTFKEFRESHFSEYMSAYRKGWLKDYTWLAHGRSPNGTWTETSCRREAKKYRSLKDFSMKSTSAYSKAGREGWLASYDWLERKKFRPSATGPTYDECMDAARKYSMQKDFRLGDKRLYMFAAKKDWLKDFSWLRKLKEHAAHSYGECREVARQYGTLQEFRENCKSMYHYAYKHGWLKKFKWLRRLR